MSINYQALQQDPQEAARKAVHRLMRYSEQVHFIYELLQNADDAGKHGDNEKAVQMGFILHADELVVWNDGRCFDERDIRGVCAIGQSSKDLTQIGAFGIGFKSIYVFTDLPEIYSGPARFCIENYLEPKELNDVPPGLKQWVDAGKTVLRLPFKQRLRDSSLPNLKHRLGNIDLRALLFLRRLRAVEWQDGEAGTGIYLSEKNPFPNIPDAERVTLSATIQGKELVKEEWIVLNKRVTPPSLIVEKLMDEAEDEDAKERVARSADQPQPIDVAFRVVSETVTPTEDCVFFAYLPTQKETHLKFLFQARYVTTPGRDNIETDSAWNKWLVSETANFLPSVLVQFRDAGMLTPSFLDLLPVANDGVPDFLTELPNALNVPLKEHALIPTDSGGHGLAKQVFYPASEELRGLLSAADLVELTGVDGAVWLHPDIRDTKASQRRFQVVKTAGVVEIGASKLVTWLAKKGVDWLRCKDDAWMLACYRYLTAQAAEKDRVRKLALVRLESGDHVCPQERPAFLPPENEMERSELAPFLRQLPVVKASLLSGEGRAAVEAFLRDLGVKPLRPEEFILNWLLPQYPEVASVAVDLNLQHIRYLLGAIDRVPAGEKRKVCEAISITPLLQARKQSSGTAIALVAPNRAYLPCLFTGNDDLEVFFAATPEAYFVLSGYKLATDEIKKWREFLLEIKCSELPRRLPKPNAGYNTEDWLIHGLEAAFAGLAGLDCSLSQKTAEATWRLLVRLLPGPEWDRKRHLQGRREIYGPRGGHHGSQSFDAAFVEQLKQNSWLPGQDGKLHKPSELFADKADNRQLLGDSVAYVTNSVLLDTEPAQWLANTLNLNLAPNEEHVLHHLRLLSGKVVAPETPSTIYAFLARQSVQVRDVFQRERLIFTTSPCPLWYSSGAVFWEDESAVFGEQRGYLSSQYPESLKPFFSSVGVAERASSRDYLRAIQEISLAETVTEETQERVHILYRRVTAALQETKAQSALPAWRARLSQDPFFGMWSEMQTGKHWLGRKGDSVAFSKPDELVWRDNDYFLQLFTGQVAVWMFDDLIELAKHLGIEPCSTAQPAFSSVGEQLPLDEWTERLRSATPEIRKFLDSPKWRGQRRASASLEMLPQLEVRLVEEAKVSFTLKGAVLAEPEPRSSYLDANANRVWIALKAEEPEYPELIGEALQDFFGTLELREFVKDLLSVDPTARARILVRWRKRGLRLTTDQPQSDKSDAQHQKPEAATKAETESPSSQANEVVHENRPQEKVQPRLSEEPKAERQAKSDETTNQSKDARDDTPTATPTESRQKQGRYRTYVGKDEPQECSSDSEAAQDHRDDLNRAGVKRVMEYEKEKAGRFPEEMSHTHPGYDVESKNQAGHIECYIEVKSCPSDWDGKGVALTKTQFEKANEFGERFWLYVVERAEREEFNIVRIQNPAHLVNQFFYDDGWRETGE